MPDNFKMMKLESANLNLRDAIYKYLIKLIENKIQILEASAFISQIEIGAYSYACLQLQIITRYLIVL